MTDRAARSPGRVIAAQAAAGRGWSLVRAPPRSWGRESYSPQHISAMHLSAHEDFVENCNTGCQLLPCTESTDDIVQHHPKCWPRQWKPHPAVEEWPGPGGAGAYLSGLTSAGGNEQSDLFGQWMTLTRMVGAACADALGGLTPGRRLQAPDRDR